MDQTIYFVIGVVIVVFTCVDLIYTTLAPRGAGFISGPVSVAVWKVFRAISRFTHNKKSLTGAGILIVVTVLLTWVLLLWAGNVFIYLADKNAVVNSTTQIPATNQERIYFTGYTLSTLGNGDFKAGSSGWQIYTAFISFTGLMLITIAITYMVPILSAVTQRRALSIQISAIGSSPQRILLNNWNGKDFKKLEEQFQSLTQEITHQGQMHLSYPVLHYFQHGEKQASLLPNLAALDEAVTLLLLYIPEDRHPAGEYLVPLRKAITSFIGSLTSLYVTPDKSEVPPYFTEELKKAAIPMHTPDLEKISHLSKRRRALRAMVEYNGWDWEDISAPVADTEMDLPLFC
ncbi:ion channel [Pontibacter sp. CAU 1760]